MRRKFLFAIPLVVVGILLGIYITPLVSGDNIYNQLEKYKYVFGTVVKNYVDDVDSQKLTESAIKGMLNDLDPHSVYITAEEMKDVEEDFKGSFDGIGVQFDVINDTITIITPLNGGPSEQLGIQAGDKIVKIDDENAVGISRDLVPKKLKGPKGTKVAIDIKRGNNPDLLHYVITRDKIPNYTVDASFLFDGSDVGFIHVNRFAATTGQEVQDAITKLKQQGMRRLIFDLRGNPGGYLDQARQVADEFLNGGDTIVYTHGRHSEFDETLMSTDGGLFEKQPVIVLINSGSASASEIVTGSLQDLDRGLVVGTTSFGKGLVQRQFPVGDGSAFRLTISRYYTPSGRCIQRPYDDKIGYRKLFGRLELNEGDNMEHSLEKIKKEIEKEKKEGKKVDDKTEALNFDSIETFKTRAGRTVLGGGGISPDYIVKSDTLTDLSVQMRIHRIFYQFVNQDLGNGNEIKKQYGGDFVKFLRNWNLTEDQYKQLRKMAEAQEIKWNDKDFEIDKDFMNAEIKANIASIQWGPNERSQVFSTIDRQVQKALTLFPEAEKIAKLK